MLHIKMQRLIKTKEITVCSTTWLFDLVEIERRLRVAAPCDRAASVNRYINYINMDANCTSTGAHRLLVLVCGCVGVRACMLKDFPDEDKLRRREQHFFSFFLTSFHFDSVLRGAICCLTELPMSYALPDLNYTQGHFSLGWGASSQAESRRWAPSAYFAYLSLSAGGCCRLTEPEFKWTSISIRSPAVVLPPRGFFFPLSLF